MSDGQRKLVYLNALRAFEAAARHSSFATAAEELTVTPPAISQHIRALEDYLGVPLFVRSKAGVALTPKARDAYPDIRDGLERLSSGLARLRGSGLDRVVTMTVPPSFAAKWLLSRVERFRALHPDLTVRLDTTDRLADFATDGVDIGVRYGFGSYPGLTSEKLLDEDLYPVCSPKLLPARRKLALAGLARMTLIHDTTIGFDPDFPNWSTWFRAHGMANVDRSRGLQVNSSLMAIQAAVDGQGVALGRSVIVAPDLRAGRLVRPFRDSAETGCAYYVVYQKNARGSAKVMAVRDWLFAEVAAEKAA
jgi:LysR family glycine cleavage system transcriptional activator